MGRGGLISFGPPQTPKSKKPQEVPRKPRKTSTPISKKEQGKTSSTEMLPPLTLSGYHTDTPITIKAEAIRKADSRSH